MAGVEYEILPHSLLEYLKYDLGDLKKKLQEPETKTNELILEIETLKDSIHELNEVFKKALDSTADEDVFAAVKNLNERIDAVVTQNETIARGMIAISDKVDQFITSSKNSASVNPANSIANQPVMSSTKSAIPSMQMRTSAGSRPSHSTIPPVPSMGTASPAGVGGMPPPPPGPQKTSKRHGFF